MGLSNGQMAFGIAAIKDKAGDAVAPSMIEAMGDKIKRVWGKAEAFRDFLAGHPISGDYKIKFLDIVHAMWQGNVNVESVSSVFNAIKEIHAGDGVNKNSFNNTYDRTLQRLDAVKRHEDSSRRNNSRSETLRRDGSDYRKVYRVEPDGSTRGYFESD